MVSVLPTSNKYTVPLSGDYSVMWTPCQNGTVHSQVVGGSNSLLVRKGFLNSVPNK